MVVTLFAMLGLVALAGLVVLYVAYPHRGEDVPSAPWIGEAMRRGVNRLPTLDNREAHEAVDAGADSGDDSGDESDDVARPRGEKLPR